MKQRRRPPQRLQPGRVKPELLRRLEEVATARSKPEPEISFHCGMNPPGDPERPGGAQPRLRPHTWRRTHGQGDNHSEPA
jgi:hypothetical protein